MPWTTPPALQKRALIRVLPTNSPGPWDASRPITTVDMPISRIDRRPSLCPKSFHDVYFLEVYAEGGDKNDVSWIDCVSRGVERLRQAGLESMVLGIW